ncbi:MAG: imidazole glycerol phosphate synthase subunit HisH, partial [Treponema sp.]|nr:imidazole glycerol phosphate synthase subunit HisH [Treponema sp.]
DYNAGNIKSVERALNSLNAPYVLSKNPLDLKDVDRIIFPGVGEASYAMEQLRLTGFDSFLKDWAASGKALMGICLGSQIIFDYSEEGDVKCLGLLPGIIRHLSKIWESSSPSQDEVKEEKLLNSTLKCPHMGWNDVSFSNGSSRLLEGVKEGTDFYFVHSYVIQPDDAQIIKGFSCYGTMIPAVVEMDNITAFQFHPEKSGESGLKILRNFVSMQS